MKTTITLLFIAIISLTLTQCKKEQSTALIDEIVGTYVVYDTLREVDGCTEPITVKTYSCVITKLSETTIKLSQFYNASYDFEASISGSNITVTSGWIPYGSYTPVITRSGTTLSGSYTFFQNPCNMNGSLKALKQ